MTGLKRKIFKVPKACDRCKKQKLKVCHSFPSISCSIISAPAYDDKISSVAKNTVEVIVQCDVQAKCILPKCDIVRPCTLCARSGFECTPINNASMPLPDPEETRNKRQRGSNYTRKQQQAVIIPSQNLQLPNQSFADSTLQSSEESSDAERTQTTGTPKLRGPPDPCIQVIGSPSTVCLFKWPSGGIFFPILTPTSS